MRIVRRIKSTWDTFISALGPEFCTCLLCDDEDYIGGDGLCDACRQKLLACPDPTFSQPLDGVTAGLQYSEEVIAAVIADYAAVDSEKYPKTGVYHYSNEGVCSWFDFTKMIAEYSGQTECSVQPCHSNEFPSPVTRPSYSVLDKTKIKNTFGISVPYWTE